MNMNSYITFKYIFLVLTCVILSLFLFGCTQTLTTQQCLKLKSSYSQYDCMCDSIFGAQARARRAAYTSIIFKSAIDFGLSGNYAAKNGIHILVRNLNSSLSLTGQRNSEYQFYLEELYSKTKGNKSKMVSCVLSDIRADCFRIDRFIKVFRNTTLADEKNIQTTLVLIKRGALRFEKINKNLSEVFKNERERQAERLDIIISIVQLRNVYEQVLKNLGINFLIEAQKGINNFKNYEKMALKDFERCDFLLKTVGLGLTSEYGEKINYKIRSNILSEKERVILSNSIMMGTAVGSARGLTAALIWSRSNEDKYVGKFIGFLLGGFMGRVIGLDRIQEINKLKFSKTGFIFFLNSVDAVNNIIKKNNDDLTVFMKSNELKKKSDKNQIKIMSNLSELN